MGAWVDAVTGTADARPVALALALLAAVSHAVFGALQKGRHDPWLSRGAIDVAYAAMAAPVALLLVPWPEGAQWAILAGAVAIHLGYKLAQAMAYSRGAFTVVYPVVRGTGPLVTVLAAGVVFGESYSAVQWGGVLLLSGGILALSVGQPARHRDRAAAARRGARLGAGDRDLRRGLHHLRRLGDPGDARRLHLPRLVLPARRAGLPLDRGDALARDGRPAGAAAAAWRAG